MKLIFALGALKNYVDRKRWVGGKSNVHVHKVKTSFTVLAKRNVTSAVLLSKSSNFRWV